MDQLEEKVLNSSSFFSSLFAARTRQHLDPCLTWCDAPVTYQLTCKIYRLSFTVTKLRIKEQQSGVWDGIAHFTLALARYNLGKTLQMQTWEILGNWQTGRCSEVPGSLANPSITIPATPHQLGPAIS